MVEQLCVNCSDVKYTDIDPHQFCDKCQYKKDNNLWHLDIQEELTDNLKYFNENIYKLVESTNDERCKKWIYIMYKDYWLIDAYLESDDAEYNYLGFLINTYEATNETMPERIKQDLINGARTNNDPLL